MLIRLRRHRLSRNQVDSMKAETRRTLTSALCQGNVRMCPQFHDWFRKRSNLDQHLHAYETLLYQHYTLETKTLTEPAEPRPSANLLATKPIPPHRPPVVPAPVVAAWAVVVAPWPVAVAPWPVAVAPWPVVVAPWPVVVAPWPVVVAPSPVAAALPMLALAVPALAVPALAVPALAVLALQVDALQVDALLVDAPPAVLVGTRVVPNVGSFRDSFSYLAARSQA